MTSLVNGREFQIGKLTTPALAELRAHSVPKGGRLRVREVVANVRDLHGDPENAGAMFQVASQFNLLEMASPNRTPEEGVGIYEQDLTQGPACAIACGAGTIYRNWLVPLEGQLGQTADRQIDCLADLGGALGGSLWEMQNGYALATVEGLAQIRTVLDTMSDGERNDLMGHLRIGIHRDTEVTLGDAGYLVTQAYGSALPLAYSPHSSTEWEPFARLVLDASYEATMRVAVINAEATGNRSVFLTLLGGGVFGNSMDWIIDAMDRAFQIVDGADLDVAIVSYGTPKPTVQRLLR